MRIVDQPVDKSESSSEQTQNQPVTPVSFASTTQVRMDIAVPSPVGQGVPQVPPVWVPLSQIKSIASMMNVAASMTSQQSGTMVTTQSHQQTEQCQKCGKKNHPTMHCHKKMTCRKCKGKDHSTKFCSMPSQEELKCTFCGKTKHSVETCKAKKKAEKKREKEMRVKRTSMVTSATVSTASSRTPPVPQAQPSASYHQAPVTHEMTQQVPLQATDTGERLQHLANGVNQLTSLRLLPPPPAPPAYTSAQSEDGQQAYSTAGSMHLIPTLAPGMYRQNNNQGLHTPNQAPSMASGTSLKSHMTEMSKTMLQLALAHKRIMNTQQQNHQTMVTVQQKQADAFEALAAATQQQKYEAMFAAVPRYDDTNKEECAVWLNQISSLAASAGCSLRLELLNRLEGDVTTTKARMDDNVSDSNLKEEIMRCFSNAPTMIQAIGVLRGIRQ